MLLMGFYYWCLLIGIVFYQSGIALKPRHISKLLYDVFVRYQFVIEAYDTAYPDNKIVSQTPINIRCNLLAPISNPTDYVTRITDEHLAPGSAINITVKATDQDDPVSRFFSS